MFALAASIIATDKHGMFVCHTVCAIFRGESSFKIIGMLKRSWILYSGDILV